GRPGSAPSPQAAVRAAKSARGQRIGYARRLRRRSSARAPKIHRAGPAAPLELQPQPLLPSGLVWGVAPPLLEPLEERVWLLPLEVLPELLDVEPELEPDREVEPELDELELVLLELLPLEPDELDDELLLPPPVAQASRPVPMFPQLDQVPAV